VIKIKLGAIEFVLKLKDNFTGVLKKAAKSSVKTTKGFISSFKKASVAIKLAWVAIGAIVIRTFRNIIEATKQAEFAQARLEQQFKNVGIATEANFREINRLADELQRTTGLSNDAVVSSAALAASYNLNFQQIKNLLPALADLTAFTTKTTGAQSNMEDSVKLMGFVLEGQIGRLKLLGITMTDTQKRMIETGSQADRLSAFLQAVETNAGGVAKAMGDTAAGEMEQFKQAMADIVKDIGENVLPALAGLAKAVTKIDTSARSVKDLSSGLNELNMALKDGTITNAEYERAIKAVNEVEFKLSAITESRQKQLDALIPFLDKATDASEKRAKAEELVNKALKNNFSIVPTEKKTTAEFKVEQERLNKELEIANEKLEEHLLQISRKGTATEEDTQRVIELTIEQERLNNSLLEVTTSIDSQSESWSKLASDLKVADAARKEALITQGQESEEFIKSNALWAEKKKRVDELNESLKQTKEITEISISSFDNLRQKLQEEIDMADEFRNSEEEIRTGLQLTDEEYNNRVERLKQLEDGNFNAAKEGSSFNDATGKDFVAATKEGAKARETLTAEINILADSSERLKLFLEGIKAELDRINATPLNDKEANWTINMVFESSSSSSGGGEGED